MVVDDKFLVLLQVTPGHLIIYYLLFIHFASFFQGFGPHFVSNLSSHLEVKEKVINFLLGVALKGLGNEWFTSLRSSREGGEPGGAKRIFEKKNVESSMPAVLQQGAQEKLSLVILPQSSFITVVACPWYTVPPIACVEQGLVHRSQIKLVPNSLLGPPWSTMPP